MVFDAPATGHGLAFFKVPRMTMEMVKMGPLHTKAFRMWNLLTDPERTSFNIVTLPEEMPVNESIELDAAAKEIGLPPGKVLVNGVYPPLFSENGFSGELDRLSSAARPVDGVAGEISRFALEAARVERGRARMHRELIERLAKALPAREMLELPFLFEAEIGPLELETLAERLTEL